MSRTILLAAMMPAPPERLFDMYLDHAAHSAFTGAPVNISGKPGAPFSGFGGVLSGMVLHVAPKRLIVQTWRSANWPADAVDSVLMLSFLPEKDGGRIEMIHANVPDSDFAGVSDGWQKYYWGPWRAYLAANK